jgi:hypothetical protein
VERGEIAPGIGGAARQVEHLLHDGGLFGGAGAEVAGGGFEVGVAE